MGGGDKGLIDLGGKPVLAHVIERLRPQVGALIVNTDADPALFAEFGLPVVPDTIPDFAGPLAGLLAGLRWTAANMPAARWVLSVSNDAPFLPSDLVRRLLEAASDGRPAAVAASNDRKHHVIGLWSAALADDLAAALDGGLRKAGAFVERQAAATVNFPLIEVGGRSVDPFFNANTPADMELARRIFEDLEGEGAA